jgi:hypothetical protein
MITSPQTAVLDITVDEEKIFIGQEESHRGCLMRMVGVRRSSNMRHRRRELQIGKSGLRGWFRIEGSMASFPWSAISTPWVFPGVVVVYHFDPKQPKILE